MPFAPFLIYVLVSSFTPGPNNLMAMTNANAFGLRKTMRFSCGVGCGFLLIMLACSYFNLYLNQLLPSIHIYMNLLASLYLLLLAVKILRDRPGSKESGERKPISFGAAMALQFINPKGILYGITAVSSFIFPFYRSTPSLIAFSLFLAFVGFLSTLTWAILGSLLQRVLARYRKPFQLTMALLLVYCAVSIVIP